MKKIDYLKISILNNLPHEKAWMLTAFSLTKQQEPKDLENTDIYFKQNKKFKPYTLLRQMSSYLVYIEESNTWEKIEDAKVDEPLFRFNDSVTIDPSWFINVKEKTETIIGNIIFNNICIIPSFNNKIPFLNGKVSVSRVEDIVAPRLQDTPTNNQQLSNEYIYVNEYTNFVDSLQYVASFSQITTYGGTAKSITKPVGIEEFKKQLIEKYGDKLSDPVQLAKFEQELIDFDEQYLKGDPSLGKLLSGKIKNVARKKMFLTVGADQTFRTGLDSQPILNSLDEGWSRDTKDHVNAMNSLRFGSFARGAETVKGGVAAKMLLRAANNYIIKDTDCGTSLGIKRIYTDSNKDKLVGRYVKSGNTFILVENIETANKLVGKEIIVRSPMYCNHPGDVLCRKCAGERLFKYPKGLTIPLTEISGIMLAASMALMHAKVLATAKIDINEVFS